ncbi:MAG: putative toxin-antitoxin system toxin component, PIN family [archaeon]
MRVTLDTNFLVSATQWKHSECYKLLRKLITENVKVYTSKEILEELIKVLERDFNRSKKEIIDILNGLSEFIRLVEPKKKINIVKDDSADNKIIECAVESNSEYIVTYDKHLLKLKEYKKIKIIKPDELDLSCV